jgi:hypothetical protein
MISDEISSGCCIINPFILSPLLWTPVEPSLERYARQAGADAAGGPIRWLIVARFVARFVPRLSAAPIADRP